MAKPNYQFERRQRDLAKKQKQEEKRQRKLAAKGQPADGSQDEGGVARDEGQPVSPGAPPETK